MIFDRERGARDAPPDIGPMSLSSPESLWGAFDNDTFHNLQPQGPTEACAHSGAGGACLVHPRGSEVDAADKPERAQQEVPSNELVSLIASISIEQIISKENP